MNDGLVIILVFFALLSYVAAMRKYWRYLKLRAQLLGQLQGPAEKEQGPARRGLPPWLLKLAREAEPLGRRYGMGFKAETVERLLHQAGSPFSLTAGHFYGVKAVLAMGALAAGIPFSLLGVSPVFALILAAGGFFGPDLWLRRAAAARQRRISVDLPDFLDTLSVCLQAGLSLDPSVRVVVTHMAGPLSEEMGRYLHEVSLGTTREQALHGLVERNDCPELKFLVESLLQGLELGVPIAQTIAAQAHDLRHNRAQKAKAQAARASPQMTLVATFIITPAVFGFIVAMLVLNLYYNADKFGLTALF